MAELQNESKTEKARRQLKQFENKNVRSWRIDPPASAHFQNAKSKFSLGFTVAATQRVLEPRSDAFRRHASRVRAAPCGSPDRDRRPCCGYPRLRRDGPRVCSCATAQ